MLHVEAACFGPSTSCIFYELQASTKKRQRPAASTNGVKKQDAAAGASSKKPRQSNEDKKDEVADGTQDKQEEVKRSLNSFSCQSGHADFTKAKLLSTFKMAVVVPCLGKRL